MDNTLTIKLTHKKAEGLIREMEALHLIQIIDEQRKNEPTSLSAKYRGILSNKQGNDLKAHIKKMRQEWSNT